MKVASGFGWLPALIDSPELWPHVWTKLKSWKSWLTWAICAIFSSLQAMLKEISAIENWKLMSETRKLMSVAVQSRKLELHYVKLYLYSI